MTAAAAHPPAHRVTTIDWWKVAALLIMFVDHYGFYFAAGEEGWRIVGRLAAPIFFFLIGFARSRRVPWTWLVLGVTITAVDALTAPRLFPFMANILINFALIRAGLPLFERTVLPWPNRLAAFVVVCALLAVVLDPFLEYSTEGWLWALVGLLHRRALESGARFDWQVRNLIAAFTAVAYVALQWVAFGFRPGSVVILAVLVAGLSVLLAGFRRGESKFQPAAPAAAIVGFLGRRTLELYALHIIVLEIYVYAART